MSLASELYESAQSDYNKLKTGLQSLGELGLLETDDDFDRMTAMTDSFLKYEELLATLQRWL